MVLMQRPSLPFKFLRFPGTVQVKRFRAVQRRGHTGGAECLCPPNDRQLPILQRLVFVECAVACLKTGHQCSRAASTVLTPRCQDFHAAGRVELQSVALGCPSLDRIPISPVHMRCIHHLHALGLPVHSWIAVQAVRQIINHGLERDGVVSEEPDVVHPAKMRKDCVIRLLVVTVTADDVSCFLSMCHCSASLEK